MDLYPKLVSYSFEKGNGGRVFLAGSVQIKFKLCADDPSWRNKQIVTGRNIEKIDGKLKSGHFSH